MWLLLSGETAHRWTFSFSAFLYLLLKVASEAKCNYIRVLGRAVGERETTNKMMSLEMMAANSKNISESEGKKLEEFDGAIRVVCGDSCGSSSSGSSGAGSSPLGATGSKVSEVLLLFFVSFSTTLCIPPAKKVTYCLVGNNFLSFMQPSMRG